LRDADPQSICSQLVAVKSTKELFMDHYRRQLILSAPAADVYRAIATQQGLRSWWTTSCDADSHVGGRATFRFGPSWKAMRIDRLEPGREVLWHCVESHLVATGVKPQEWLGTDIAFRLTPRGTAQTVLDFEHVGLTPAIECWEICNEGWNQFLGSLQSLVETGEGAPFDPALAASCHAVASRAASLAA
jgi:uncharacterized protein YndB with AHSA1/START domain